MWTGHIGIFTANDAKNASHSQVWASGVKAYCISAGIELVPLTPIMNRIAASMSTEPSRV